MENTKGNNIQDEDIQSTVAIDLDDAKEFAKSLNIDEVNSGKWFVLLLQKVVEAYDKNARSDYFVQKYPGLPRDEIADKLISVTIRYATVAGGVAGAATTASMITTLTSFGMTAALAVGTIGAEMFYLARIQMRLVLDLAVLYDLQLDTEDPEDILMIFGYAMGIAPTEMLGKGVQYATANVTAYAVKKYISKGTLKALQDFGKKIGVRILQRSVLKYTVPVVSSVVGSSYNYVSTKSLGQIAKSHIRNRGKVTEELRMLVSRQNSYSIAFPAAAIYMAQIDGEFSDQEKVLYRALLTRMTFDAYEQATFQKLLKDEKLILEMIAQVEDDEIKHSFVEVIALIAICDGELVDAERDFLIKSAEQLNVPVDINDLERRVEGYRIALEDSFLQKAKGSTSEAASKARKIATSAARSAKGAVAAAGGKVTGALGNILWRKKANKEELNDTPTDTTTDCQSCGASVMGAHKFCPSCGASQATEKVCVSCLELISVTFGFCPHCGSVQN